MPNGLFAGREVVKKVKANKWKDWNYQRKALNIKKKYSPFEGSHQARGIVLEKRQLEQKQPHSGMVKCVRVQLIKNGKQVTAHAPRNGAINHIQEHDEVLLQGIGGSNAGPYGSLPSVKWKVVKVNGISLDMLIRGKAKRPTK